MSIDEKHVNGSGLAYIWNLIIDRFVKKEEGKVLSSNDYSDDEKDKLSKIEPAANKTIVENVFSSISSSNALSANKGRELNDKIEELSELVNADEVYILDDDDVEGDIPDDAVIAVFTNEEADEIDLTDFYTKPEIDEIIIKADFKKGKSAYEVAVECGFDGTEEEWISSLKGDPFEFEDYTDDQLLLLKGDKGDQGDPFKFEDFTEDQLLLIKGEKGDPFEFEDFTEEQLELIKGDAGYTPERGKDYWTDEDIDSIKTYIEIKLSEFVEGAPEALKTIDALAAAIGDDPNFAVTVAGLIGKNSDLIKENERLIKENEKLIGEKANASDLSDVAKSGEYADLINPPLSLPANGGNSDTVDGLHFVVSNSAPTVDDRSVVTIVI